MACILFFVPRVTSFYSRTTFMTLLTNSTLWIGWFQIGPPIVSWPSQVLHTGGTSTLGSPTLDVTFSLESPYFSSSSFGSSTSSFGSFSVVLPYYLYFLTLPVFTSFLWTSTISRPSGCSQKDSQSMHWYTLEYFKMFLWHPIGLSLTLMNNRI